MRRSSDIHFHNVPEESTYLIFLEDPAESKMHHIQSYLKATEMARLQSKQLHHYFFGGTLQQRASQSL